MEIFGYILLGLVAAMAIIFVVLQIIKICKMSPEEKKKVLVTYLKGLVALAEKEIGAGHGAEKLAMVEDYFKTKAPKIYKLMLFASGKDNLKELIELALSEIKNSFAN